MRKNFKLILLIIFVAGVFAAAFYSLRHYRQAEPKGQTYPPLVGELLPQSSPSPDDDLSGDVKSPDPVPRGRVKSEFLTPPRGTGSGNEAYQNFLFIGFDPVRGIEDWQEKRYEGKTNYQVMSLPDGGAFLSASSEATSSVIAKSVNLVPDKPYFLSWQWRHPVFPDRPNLEFNGKEDNDYAIRVYVLFKGLTFITPEVIQYVWDDHYPEGTYGDSPYTKRVKTVVVEYGVASNPDEWVFERHDIIEDYRRLFGKEPKRDITAIAVMSDSDNTGTQSAAEVKDIWLQLPSTGRDI